jgi:outer membrane protein assembly factor BamB
VLASAESQTLFALNKKTGEVVWKKDAEGFGGTWGTPIVVDNPQGEKELVIGVPYEVWAFEPQTGKFRWYVSVADSDSYCSSLIANNGLVYSVEGRNGGGYAMRTGGSGDVTKANVVWEQPLRNRIGTPILVDGKLFYFSGRIAKCVDANNGQELFEARLPQGNSTQAPQSGGPGRGQGRRGGGGMMGGQDYSSPVSGDGKIYYVTRSGDIHVIKVADKFESLAVNRLTDQPEDFSASPSISDGQLFIRSSQRLYCVGE